jgi:serine/threonine protein kinase/formylglycine-generating enzyme required for sulfatase activity
LEVQLGQGGFGCVYKAHDPSLGRTVAIKVPRWDRPLRPNEFTRFLNEGRALAKVVHPAIVSVYDVGQTDGGFPYVVMEFVEGKPLRQSMGDEPMELALALDLLLQIGEALRVAHTHSVIHRDLKPGNVIVTSEHRIKLVDFGLALHDDLCWSELTNNVEGTLPYMAPEQTRGENHRIDGQTDVWSFGVVMYRLLTSKMPFQSKLSSDLARQICYREPKPLRQLNPKVTPELQRICLRCLSKKLADRYPSMADVLDELRAAQQEWLARSADTRVPPVVEQVEGPPAGNDRSGSAGTHPETGKGRSTITGTAQNVDLGLRIVPKGLHSFSEFDAEFFLGLLPGPRDRHGIPESIRFWKSRIESKVAEGFRAGLIYGPSGCGKSSFVRAGLIPQLPSRVLPVYLDCAGRDTEARIVRQIHRVVPSVDPEQNLADALRHLRTADHLHADDKILLILDQFEQWLSARGRYAGEALTEALRHCDGEKLCCLLLVRDDFWMSVGEFLSELEVEIHEGGNAMAFPLFDETHARNVLAAIGRAHQRLPGDSQGLDKAQRQFLKEAVQLLSTDGKVICVHLTVFAEMMKGRDWTAHELRRLGGLSGVGVRFLEDTFGSPSARVEGRRIQPLARQILRQLLPQSATTIKGSIKSDSELWAGLSEPGTPADFARALQFLDHDVKLIAAVESPQSPSGQRLDAEVSRQEDPRHFYHLSHDFLVEPIRQWLHQDKLAHWRGRAELQLESLGDQWNARNDPRYFPGGMDLLRILWGADAQTRQQYHNFLRAARRRYLMYATAALVVLGVTFGLFALSRRQVNQNEALRRADRFLQADPGEVPTAIEQQKPYLFYAEPRLRSALDATDPRQKLHAHYFVVGNLAGGDQLIPPLIDLLDGESVVELRNVILALRAHPDKSKKALRERLESGTDERNQSLLANLLTELDDTSGIARALQLRPDPTLRTTFVHSFERAPHDIVRLVRSLESVTDYDVHSGMILALGQLNPSQLGGQERSACLAYFERLFRKPEASGGAHSAAEWALLRWGQSEIVDSLEGPTETGGPWFVRHIDGEALTFVKIPAGDAQLGVGKPEGIQGASHSKPELVRCAGFYVATTTVTEHMFAALLADSSFDFRPDPLTPGKSSGPDVGEARRGFPFADADWSDAVQFCNWLAHQQSLSPGYALEGQYWFGQDLPSHSYRLPTSAEWEYAYRCRTLTGSPFCTSLDLSVLQHYCWYGQPNPGHIQSKMPTAWGLFDFPANTIEWTNDAFGEIEIEAKIMRGGHNMSPLETLLAGSFYRHSSHSTQARVGIRIVFTDQMDTIVSREPLPKSE